MNQFAFIRPMEFRIGQVIKVNGEQLRIVSYKHTGKSAEAVSMPNAQKFKRVTLIVAGGPFVGGVQA